MKQFGAIKPISLDLQKEQFHVKKKWKFFRCTLKNGRILKCALFVFEKHNKATFSKQILKMQYQNCLTFDLIQK